MFPEKFTIDHKMAVISHNAVIFRSELSVLKITKMLSKGVCRFLSPDTTTSVVGVPNYKDNRIVGLPTIYNRQQCCSFTKNTGNWYLFPINIGELTNVGLTPDDLIEWITFLNKSKMGFKYLYFGKEGIDSLATIKGVQSQPLWNTQSGMVANEFYWIGFAPTAKNKTRNPHNNVNVPYLQWIALRYLINTVDSVQVKSLIPNRTNGYPYYHIPRATMLLHKKYGLSPVKAFLYAHVSAPYYSYYSLAYTDYMGLMYNGSNYAAQAAPAINLNAEQFKLLWRCHTGSMNATLTEAGFGEYTRKNISTILKGDGVEFKRLFKDYKAAAPYAKSLDSILNMQKLFHTGKYQEFIDYIDTSYGLTPKTNKSVKSKTLRKKSVRNVTKKTINL